MYTKPDDEPLDAYADDGNVVIIDDDEHVRATLTREQAIELLPKLVSAIHKAGDLSDPFAVALSLAVAGLYKAKESL